MKNERQREIRFLQEIGFLSARSEEVPIDVQCKLRVELNHKKKSMTYKHVLTVICFISLCSFFNFHF
jgi:hypothetical protein